MNIYKFETACKATSLLNLFYGIVFAFLNYKMIKTQFLNTAKEEVVDTEYADFKMTEIQSNKDRIKERICYTPKYRGYSFSSLNSKRNSVNNVLE